MSSLESQARRQLLQLVGASAATWSLPRSAWSQSRLNQNPFTLGVASGSPTPGGVVLWTRLHGAKSSLGGGADEWGPAVIPVRWELAHDEQFNRIVHSGQSMAGPELAHSVHVEVAGLEADRWYFYRFMAGDFVSATGRTRTLPQPDAVVARLRLAYASCQKWEDGYFSAWRHMREENLDLVLFLGDYIYEYPALNGRVRVPTGGWVLSLEDYRQRYALYKGELDLQAMHAACPWLLTWDDHEVQNDYAGVQAGYSSALDPSKPEHFLARRAAAYQAWYEHMPVRASALTQGLAGLATGADLRIYNRLRYGQLASLYLLDGRQYKDPQACTAGGGVGSAMVKPAECPQWHDPSRSLLGLQQERWLYDEFSKRPAHESGWNVLGQPTLFGQRDLKVGPGQTLWNDGWDGYPAARARLTDALSQHAVANPVILGGDVHENWVGHVKADYPDPGSASVGVEFCGTSISSRSGGNAKTAQRLAENPHFVFADALRKGYGVAEFTPKQLTTSLRVVDDVTRQDTQIETLARFVVQAGRPVLERA
ncbi:MAG: alkaline phosphatase D family protein [Gammaproteobacteria bacterium]|uniref:alkaline phosphatase D family protein n=1 Tax=Rhodoferax sp. TaxID=50421 RepID=UPI0017DDDE85|nr:alkaline phosphatase D family protein [Rhodoferax sp.]MBU3898156.1 alkaline phosphatase D family protein [Gammaproteobacteria bacterium]MBA3058563.1 alkaline phosphatase [Rhodoferax sp.]MBU3999501.1 alkaline phosphatase D family protein [Gammaproteobacteria bacterium]MBU4081650.1 alkaline phosphatase D family protein [Gammaproteobacteria bacterium]MBU4115239.1 alkaline phosphatase D family protein [Gammaproteobacteria bacterium]